ncbi:unnamed protein product [Linum tenue]|uniref:Uncharacterized protein n=1 Tax=Linum tenue TaxID=586396 RepID=A0AAV0Q4M1_9ROSI|nr:unnamed protein product [Linum tenue]
MQTLIFTADGETPKYPYKANVIHHRFYIPTTGNNITGFIRWKKKSLSSDYPLCKHQQYFSRGECRH